MAFFYAGGEGFEWREIEGSSAGTRSGFRTGKCEIGIWQTRSLGGCSSKPVLPVWIGLPST